jgi:hypothetical protein
MAGSRIRRQQETDEPDNIALNARETTVTVFSPPSLLASARVVELVWSSRDCCRAPSDLLEVMMMIIHQVRHGRQDNHSTNHVRCAETSMSKQSRRHIEAKLSKTINLSIMCDWSTTPAKQSTEKGSRQCLLGKHNP